MTRITTYNGEAYISNDSFFSILKKMEDAFSPQCLLAFRIIDSDSDEIYDLAIRYSDIKTVEFHEESRKRS